MIRKILLVVLAIRWLAGTVAPGQEISGMPVFGDDFGATGLFVENWDVTKGAKCEGGRAIIPSGNNITLRRKAEGDFAITADLTVERPVGKDVGHCGVTIDGINFMITPRQQPIANTAYRVPGEERSRGASAGAIPGFEFGKPCRIMISRQKLGESYKYSYKLNGKPVDSFNVMMPVKGRMAFYGYKTNIGVDNFQLYSVKSDGSNNLVINSSFEQLQEGMPNYMKPLFGGKYEFDGKWETFLGNFAIDRNEKMSGENSVRMTRGEMFPNSIGVGTHNVSVAAKTPVTFSIYLKASDDEFPVTLNIWELWHKNHSKPIKISKQWARYVFTLENPEKAIVRANMKFDKPGTIWVDDIQVEVGSEATKYMPSSLDKDKFVDTEKASVPVIKDDGISVTAEKTPVSGGMPRLELYTRLNYYMNEDNAVIVGSLALPDVEKLAGRITVAGRTLEVKMEPEFTFDIPLKGIENGAYQVTLDVCKGTEKLVSGTTRLVKRELKAGATRIDLQRRCLVVGGKPYLAIAPHFGLPLPDRKPEKQEMMLKNILRLHREMGYRCLMLGSKDDQPFPQQTQAFLDICAREGIKIIYWPYQSWNNRDKVDPVARFQMLKADNIIAWLVVDEPELYAKSDEVETFMEAHRKASPWTPVFMNNTLIGIPARFAGLKTDILMLDDYLCNRENRKVIEMLDATTMMMEAGRGDRKPVFYFLEGENLQNHYRECTYAEQIAETYGVIIAGATGISYFLSLPVYPEDYRASVDVNRELLELEDVIFSLEKTSKAVMTDSVVKSMTRKLEGKVYVITLNSDNHRAADVEIKLPPEFRYAANAKVQFENRNIDLKNGKISDKFKPLEQHVYVADIVN